MLWTVHQAFGALATALGRGAGKTRPSPTGNRVRLALESLDLRFAPSALPGTTVPTPTQSDLYLVAENPAPAAPEIINFVGAEIVGGLYRFSGDVVDAAPGGLTITLSGHPDSVQGVTVTTDSNGHFEIVLTMKMDGSDDGTVEARTVNAQGVESDVAYCIVHPRS